MLEYTFQIELKINNKSSELGMFQELVNEIDSAEPHTKFLPWYTDGETDLPAINKNNLPYSTIKGQVKLKHYMGAYNRSKGKVYRRV